MKMLDIYEELKKNSYPGRGIVIGRSADGKKASGLQLTLSWEEA